MDQRKTTHRLNRLCGRFRRRLKLLLGLAGLGRMLALAILLFVGFCQLSGRVVAAI